MKKGYLFIFSMLIFVLYPRIVKASSDIEFVCLNEVMKGYQVECEINLVHPDANIKGVQANFEFGEAFSYVKTIESTDWKISSSNKEGFISINVDGINKNSLVAKVNFIVSNEAVVRNEYEIKLRNIQFSDGEKDISIGDKSVGVRILSVLDIMKEIRINGESLELKDGVTNYSYTIKSQDTSAEIAATLKEDGYEFEEGYGPRTVENLEIGQNEFLIKVVKENREIITFTIHINREKLEEDNVSNNPKTSSFSLVIVSLLFILSFGSLIFVEQKKYRKDRIK